MSPITARAASIYSGGVYHSLLPLLYETWACFSRCSCNTLASGEVGVAKPDPGLLLAALEQIGSEAEHTVYVGDNYWADVVASRRAGITPVLLDPFRLFPEADCLLLDQIDDILQWLPGRNA